MLANRYSETFGDKIQTYLHHGDSIPAFLSSVTLDLFQRQTVIQDQTQWIFCYWSKSTVTRCLWIYEPNCGGPSLRKCLAIYVKIVRSPAVLTISRAVIIIRFMTGIWWEITVVSFCFVLPSSDYRELRLLLLCLCLFHDFHEVIGNVNLTDANIDSTRCQYCAFRTSDHRPITKLLEALCFYAATFAC